MEPGYVSPVAGAKRAASDLAHHVIARNPRTWGIVIIAMAIVLLIVIVVAIKYRTQYKDCENAHKAHMLGTDPLGNLNTGSNNPMWYKQMGNAGHGGSMDSTYQEGQPRVWGASAEGGHDMVVEPILHYGSCGAQVSPAAVGEARTLEALQAVEPTAGSAKGMSDNALMRIMSGGSA